MASQLESFSKWLQLKIYQFEVHFSVYIFTPFEKFVIYSVLFLLISLTFIATVLYLPQHVQFIISRAWFYMHGDACDSAGELAKGVVTSVTGMAAQTAVDAMREL
ncbi:uncharacterized protein B0T15DRAFT_523419 [Chaetomium strumarium]|uniref:Uncharacterized protein n=1 Tax=Chaetomium strumarium TaxID=1170767 RepID=A0AAJ0GYG8_9PEZI|nr:hypothetical protein B0T15DRAFT_523419 [Chaetomium strumarium]